MHRSLNIERAEARFRHLCCTVPSGPLAGPLIFDELRKLIPYGNGIFQWFDASGPKDIFYTAPEIIAPSQLYHKEYCGRLEAEIGPTMQETAISEFGPRHYLQVLRIPKADYYRHAAYGDMMQPAGMHTFIRCMTRDGLIPVGGLMIGREEGKQDFDEADMALLSRLDPFISHAFNIRDDPTQGLYTACKENEALIVTDRSGRIQWQSPDAKSLLSMSQGSMMKPPVLHNGLLRTVQTLDRLSRGEAVSAPPVWRNKNIWGTFTARTYWLNPEEPAESLVGIVLERSVPQRVKLFEAAHRLGLPARQEQVCFLLALGKGEEDAARELGMSRNTVIYHRRQIYNRLGVESRQQLVERLLNTALDS